MEEGRKKVLTQSVGMLQKYLVPTADFLKHLRMCNVLTADEVQTIEKDSTVSGKVVELVCFVKRKDSRTYDKFVNILEQKEPSAAAVLRNTQAENPDSRTEQFLDETLQNYRIAPATMKKLKENLIDWRVHKDSVSEQRKWLLQNELITDEEVCTCRNKCPIHEDPPQSASKSKSKPKPIRQTPRTIIGRTPRRWEENAHGQCDDVQQLQFRVEQLEELLEQKQEECRNLQLEKMDCYEEYQSALDQNVNLIEAVASLQNSLAQAHSRLPIPVFERENSTTLSTDGERPLSSPESEKVIEDLRNKLYEKEVKNKELEKKLEDVEKELTVMKIDLEKVKQQEKKYKEMLKLSANATEEEVMQKINTLSKNSKSEIDKIRSELSMVLRKRSSLENHTQSLEREKQNLEFQVRNMTVQIKRLHTLIRNPSVVRRVPSIVNPHSNERRILTLPRVSVNIASGLHRDERYCLFCKSEYVPQRQGMCQNHYQPYKNNQWRCCGEGSHRARGCLGIPHMYVQHSLSSNFVLTDGKNCFNLNATVDRPDRLQNLV